MKKDSKDWREFEQLVSRIERMAAPGVVVKSPDRIRDLTTGQLREVDASIRTRVGTAEVLITVECRRRSRTSDDTWIEQLATKRQKIGASKTIAVSAKGFTESAAKSARQFGIELRTLSEVKATDIDGWFLPGGATHVFRLIENIKCFVVLYEDSGEPSEYGFWAPDVEAPMLNDSMHKLPSAARDYIPLLERTNPELFHDVPFDGTRIELEFPIEWALGELFIATPQGGKLYVQMTKLVATVSYQSAVCELAKGMHHEYAAPDGSVVQHTSFSTELLGLPVTFEHQSDSTGERKVSCKFSAKPKRQAPQTREKITRRHPPQCE